MLFIVNRLKRLLDKDFAKDVSLVGDTDETLFKIAQRKATEKVGWHGTRRFYAKNPHFPLK